MLYLQVESRCIVGEMLANPNFFNTDLYDLHNFTFIYIYILLDILKKLRLTIILILYIFYVSVDIHYFFQVLQILEHS